MSWLFAWWRRRHEDSAEQAEAALETARQIEPEIRRVGEELRRLERRNHFSPMVQEAIRRHKEA